MDTVVNKGNISNIRVGDMVAGMAKEDKGNSTWGTMVGDMVVEDNRT